MATHRCRLHPHDSNIRNKQLDDLRYLRQEEFEKFARKKNLVPKSDIFAIAKVELLKDQEKLI